MLPVNTTCIIIFSEKNCSYFFNLQKVNHVCFHEDVLVPKSGMSAMQLIICNDEPAQNVSDKPETTVS